MKVSDAKLAEVRERGFTVVPGFLDAETLAEARAALWNVHPNPDDYFADPSKYPHYAPASSPASRPSRSRTGRLSRLPVYPDLIDAMERLTGTDDIEVYKIELWAKYAGAIDYAQAHHRDFGNHSLVVPREDGVHTQYTTFLLLSDVTELDAPDQDRAGRAHQRPAADSHSAGEGRAGRSRGLRHRPGRQPDDLSHQHPAPRLGLRRAGALAVSPC